MRLPLPRNLTTRLVLTHLLVGAVSIGLITLVAFNFIIEGGRREIRDNLTDLALNVSNSLEAPFLNPNRGSEFIPTIQDILENSISPSRGIQVSVFTNDGALIFSNFQPATMPLARQLQPSLTSTLQGKINQFSGRDAQLGDVFTTLVPVSHLATVYGALVLSIPYEPNLEETRNSLLLMLVIAWLVLLAVGLGAYLVAESVNRPMRNLIKMTERMKAGDLRAQVELSGPDELVQLSTTLNQMAAQLQDNLDGMRAFVANASHELRTPLTAMKLNTDALLNGAYDDPAVSQRFLMQLEDEIDLMSRTVNDLLDLSRIEANRNQPSREPLDLVLLVSETCASFQTRAGKANLTLKCSTPPLPVILSGNDDQLRRMLSNLVDNAIKNTPAGGWVEINLLRIGEQRIRLEVSDNGVGIPAEHLPRIFERFYHIENRPSQTRSSGTGLGLAIVKSIVEAHQAHIGLSSAVGKGTTFWIEFPPNQPQKSGRK